ncbi:MAG: translation initiation factor IF-2 [Bacteroidales bacterium]|nr:translation initiation factor IF-2 [Bacteroidales bacterium]
MSEIKVYRLAKVAIEMNVGIDKIVDFLKKKGYDVSCDPNQKLTQQMYDLCTEEFLTDSIIKRKTENFDIKSRKKTLTLDDEREEKYLHDEIESKFIQTRVEKLEGPRIIGKIEHFSTSQKTEEKTTKETTAEETKHEPIEESKFIQTEIPTLQGPHVIGKINLDENKVSKTDKKETKGKTEDLKIKKEELKTPEEDRKKITTQNQENLQVEQVKTSETIQVDNINKNQEISRAAKPVFSTKLLKEEEQKKPKRKRIKVKKEFYSDTDRIENRKPFFKKGKKKKYKKEISEEEIEQNFRNTLNNMQPKTKSTSAVYRREKREAISQKLQEEIELKEKEKNILKISEFITVNELATMMNVPVNEVIKTCMNLGLFVSINQRLDYEYISLIAEEYGYKVELITVDVSTDYEDTQIDNEEDLVPRPPIVTVMGHVDHGKTKLLDYIRNTNVVAGEAGGITQHIGAYSVQLPNGRKITFIDTPGHEAFTAMRARGAQLTDIAIIVIAADDGIKPQTIEAINHAQAAGVRMIFAINKIDKPEANPDRVKEQLAQMNILVEEWGGNYQCQEISAKLGTNVDLLLEKVLAEADINLNLTANPKRRASGIVIESSLDKGKGYVANCLVKNGTLRVGDIILAGIYYGRVKAMYNERNQRLEEAGPSTPVQVLGLNGAPQAGDKFIVLTSEQEAKEIATKRAQILREQSFRTRRHITLDELSKRLKVGFKEVNIIVKGDVDGSIEALSDSLIKLSNEEVKVNVIHKGVGQISESDVMLAAASNAIIIGFQVRPSVNARKLAEQEQIEIRLYSIIYDAIEDLKQAIEGMLSPVIKEEITGSAEIKETFKISKVGTVAGCVVLDGKIFSNSKVRIIRNGIVVYTGNIKSLKRYKDDVKEVQVNQECGIAIENFNDIKVGDIIEAFIEVETKKKV